MNMVDEVSVTWREPIVAPRIMRVAMQHGSCFGPAVIVLGPLPQRILTSVCAQ